ncbi:MAG: HNH endonuclease [Boseongicola sp. SB0664_bin_43]|uniref:HNH endonuclease n=1 Tax=Boseongicola sp. SB0664_bin_43 TaxID=2604844 RepID=A0A6B0Y1P6_9RHOB|nr:HNH endonuclease [Boseongicola sp. SB0664_bin_43]MYG83671.1 HNH endonuclease [Gemmatimonadota bacterium]
MAEPERECVYCGSTEQTTDDHVPPKSLFPKPRPSNLITVPCCRKCNHSASKDDEYFRSMLAMRNDAGEHSEAQKVLPAVFRSLRRTEGSGFTKKLLQNVTPVDVRTPAGLYVGRAGGYKVENESLERVVARIDRGFIGTTTV